MGLFQIRVSGDIVFFALKVYIFAFFYLIFCYAIVTVTLYVLFTHSVSTNQGIQYDFFFLCIYLCKRNEKDDFIFF